jgi:hypothetical protein
MRRFFGRALLLAALTFGLVGGAAKQSEPADNTERTTAAATPPPPVRALPQGPKAKDSNGASDTIVLLGALFLAGSDINGAATLVDQARQGRAD